VLDDIAMRRPWNLVVKTARLRASIRLRTRGLDDGVTVVLVSWNTRQVTADVLTAVQALSPADTRILVVDNASGDGSREMLATWPGIRTMLVRSNAGHGVALDLAVCATKTRIAVTLDSDAVPLRAGWLEPAVAPVRSGAAVLAGSRSSRGFVHPMYLAVDTATFVQRGLSFQVHREPGLAPEDVSWGVNAWDTGELITPRLNPAEVAFVDRTPNPVDDLPGMIAGGVVYHHGGVSRGTDGAVSPEALEGWRRACRALGLGEVIGVGA
jgi:glycosyltransferase involved in cell wall biosynthesis